MMDGFFLNEKIDSKIMFNSLDYDFQMRADITQPIFQALFFAGREKLLCSRRYQKLPEILGSLTGMCHLLMFFCFFMINLVTYISTLKYLLNKLYCFPDIKSFTSNKKLSILNNNDNKNNTEAVELEKKQFEEK